MNHTNLVAKCAQTVANAGTSPAPTAACSIAKIATALFVLVCISACARGGSSEVIPLNEAIRTGTLDNGMQYFIQENALPEGRAQIRLAINAGALLEDDDQLGYAHFLEHMLFNGTEKYPRNELIAFLETLGIAFGADLNASTSYNTTYYLLPVETSQIDIALDVLEQWAFHASITNEDVIDERGVIQEEKRTVGNFPATVQDLFGLAEVLYQNSRYTERDIIGTDESIATATSEPIRRFYEEWYRPEIMALIVVGDVDSANIETKIRDRFSGYTNPEGARERPNYSVPFPEEQRFQLLSSPIFPGTTISLYNRLAKPVLRVAGDYKDTLTEELFYAMLNERLGSLLLEIDSPFLDAAAGAAEIERDVYAHRLRVTTNSEGIENALSNISLEQERLKQNGFLESELERAKSNLLRQYEEQWNNRNIIPHSQFVDPIMFHYLREDPNPSIDWLWPVVQSTVPDIELADFTPLINERLNNERTVMQITGTPELETVLVNGAFLGQETSFAVLDSAAGTSIEPWVDRAIVEELIANPPAPGSIVSEGYNDANEIYTWELSNGATVYARSLAAEEVLFASQSPGGLSALEDEDWLAGALALELAQAIGLGDISDIDLQRFLAGTSVELSFTMDNYTEKSTGSSSADDLETLLQLNYLFHSDLGTDESGWNAYRSRRAQEVESESNDPVRAYNKFIISSFVEDHPRSQDLKAEDYQNANYGRSREIFTERFANIADFRFFFTGAFDVQELREQVEQWIASIPANTSAETEEAIDRGLNYFTGDIRREIRAGEDFAIGSIYWSSSDIPWTAENDIELSSLSSLLDIIATQRIREDLGVAYATNAQYLYEDSPTTGYIIGGIYVTPPDVVDEMGGVFRSEIENLIANGPSDAIYAERISATLRSDYEEGLGSNEWWREQMQFIVQNNLDWSYIQELPELYEEITTASLQNAARKYLANANTAEIILYPDEF